MRDKRVSSSTQCTQHLTVRMIATVIFVSAIIALSEAGITIPKEDCRWLVAEDFNTDLKCDGNEVAVGSCASGFHADCPGLCRIASKA